MVTPVQPAAENTAFASLARDAHEQYTGLDAELYDIDYSDYDTGDKEFYVVEAVKCGKPMLELACGTGRITIPTAVAGVEVIGIDISEDMLAIARQKVSELDPDVAARITLLQGDMRDFQLDRKFDLITIPFRAFICLTSADDQKAALRNVHRHLNPGGKLILNFFDPDLREVLDQSERFRNVQKLMNRFTHPVTGNRVKEWSTWDYNITEQLIEEVRNFIEYAADDSIVKSTFFSFKLRYIFRWEMHHLFELCGFKVEELYGDFNRGPFRAGGEQVWIVTAVEGR